MDEVAIKNLPENTVFKLDPQKNQRVETRYSFDLDTFSVSGEVFDVDLSGNEFTRKFDVNI